MQWIHILYVNSNKISNEEKKNIATTSDHIIIWRNRVYICILLKSTNWKPNSISAIYYVTSHFAFDFGVSFWTKEWNGPTGQLRYTRRKQQQFQIRLLAWIFFFLIVWSFVLVFVVFFFFTMWQMITCYTLHLKCHRCQLRNTHAVYINIPRMRSLVHFSGKTCEQF